MKQIPCFPKLLPIFAACVFQRDLLGRAVPFLDTYLPGILKKYYTGDQRPINVKL